MKGTKSFRTEKLGSESWASVQSMLRVPGKIPGRVGLCYHPQAGPSVPHPGGSIPVTIYLPRELTVQLRWEKRIETPGPSDPESQWRRAGRPLGGGGAKVRTLESTPKAELRASRHLNC